jgi:peptidoglycan/LPS O-acetylase OafA/YrhL
MTGRVAPFDRSTTVVAIAMKGPLQQHFLALDGLRGAAAIAVVIFHMGAYVRSRVPFSSAYLAVDLFFALSGFVLSYAYDARLSGGMTWSEFMHLRLIRLYPAYLVGVACGMVSYLVTWPTISAAKFALALGAALVFLPLPVDLRDGFRIFPLDGPAWSLFFELVANLSFVWFYTRFDEKWILVILVASGLMLITIGVIHGNLFVGWDPPNLLGGFPRVFFSFFAGVLIHRRRPRGLRRGGSVMALLAILTLISPTLAGMHPIYDLAAILLLFPMSIAAVAGLNLKGLSACIARILGDLSYPLYIIHYPCIQILKHFTHDLDQSWKLLSYCLVGSGLVFASWAIAQFYERPVRRRLATALSGKFVSNH